MNEVAASMMPQRWGTFQILSLDGGGIKGLFAAAVLAKLEEKCGTSITRHFDLITGTSTGGLIALGLGLGIPPRQIVEFYLEHGPSIFGNRLRWRSILQWVFRKFPQWKLEAAVRSESAFGCQLLGHSSKRLVIPAYNLGAEQVRVFKTAHHPRLTTDYLIPAWQIALATTAAPTYFPACRQINRTRLIDGGVWANNPAMAGVVEAVSMLNARLDEIRVFSIGTTDSRTRRPKYLNSAGRLPWMWKSHVIDIITRGQSVGVNGQVLHLIGEGNFFRLDPLVPDGIYSMDRLAFDDLMAEAEHQALHFSPRFSDTICRHTAPPFIPCTTCAPPATANPDDQHEQQSTK